MIGVDHDHNILDLERDLAIFDNKVDDFLKNFEEQFKSKIREQIYSFINSKMINVKDEKVLLVNYKISKSKSIINYKDFLLEQIQQKIN